MALRARDAVLAEPCATTAAYCASQRFSSAWVNSSAVASGVAAPRPNKTAGISFFMMVTPDQ
jgi:hypothetical protein